MWGDWDSSQVLMLTFEFSSVMSQWPHHLMPLNCFSPSLLAFLPIPTPPSLSFSFCLYLAFLPASPAPPPSPLSPLYSTYLPKHTLPPRCLPPVLPLPGEWQAHKCSNDSSGGVSVTAIEAVTGAGLSLGANAASAAEPLSPWQQTERKRETQTEREKSPPPPNHSPTCFLSPTKQSPWQYGPVTLPTACQRLSTLEADGPQQMDGRDWFVQGFAVT